MAPMVCQRLRRGITANRHLQQRDYESAQDDFNQALELDPRNAAAKRGLQVSQGAQTVDTLSGVLRH